MANPGIPELFFLCTYSLIKLLILTELINVNDSISSIHTQRWFYAFILVHLIVWTLAPTLVRFNLPLDTIEGAIWGHQMEWGYDKNPFMNAWLTNIAIQLGGTSSWVIYLFCQITVVTCFWAVWQLGKKMLPPVYALLAVMLLEFMQYYNLHSIELNDNTLELAFWSLTALFFYQALTRARWRDWLLVAVFAALGMMTKYYTAMFLFCMFLFLLFNAKARQQFKNPAFYFSAALFLVLIAPHFIWLFSHDFITIKYVLNRTSSTPSWLHHITFPLKFALEQLEVALPAFIMALVLYVGKKNQDSPVISPSAFDKSFLYFVGLGPFVLTVLLSIMTGIQLRGAWGQPLLSLWGILFIVWFKPQVSLSRFYHFMMIFYLLLVVVAGCYCAALMRAAKPSSANYPGERIAETLTNQWHAAFHRPLNYIGGSRWLGGNIAFYSLDRPSVYINWDKEVSFWVDEKKLKQDGAIFVWDPNEDNQASIRAVRTRFPKMGAPQILHFTWMRNQAMKPVEITVVFLPPEGAKLAPRSL